MIRAFAIAVIVLTLTVPVAWAGHSVPNYIDGCQSEDGRYTVTAELASGKEPGPFTWRYTWTDMQTKTTRTYDAKGVASGQVYGHLFMPPGGETFVLFTNVIIHSPGKYDSHGAGHLVGEKGSAEWKKQEAFSRRIIIYKSSDGSIIKELGMDDFLKPEEWDSVLLIFNRALWLRDYPGLSYRSTPRSGYAFYQISPDYSVLEFRVVTPRTKSGDFRTVRVSLTDGRIIPLDEKLDAAKTPGRPFKGPDRIVDDGYPLASDRYVAPLDPVRVEGKLAKPPADVLAKITPTVPLKLELVKDGYTKLDSPTWLPAEKCWLYTDLETGKLYRLDAPDKISVVREKAGRGKVGPDGQWYGILDGAFVSWKPGDEPAVIADKAPDGKAWEVNDLAISEKFAYLTTLKDPEKGRLTVIDLAKKTGTVIFDGEKDADLVNPNGVALSPDGKSLYVGISSYKDRRKSCVYRFPVGDDGVPDVTAGKKTRFANVQAPDGIAVDSEGTVYFTAGNVVKVFAADGKMGNDIKIPKGSGTNLAFGGPEGKTLCVSTASALYAGK